MVRSGGVFSSLGEDRRLGRLLSNKFIKQVRSLAHSSMLDTTQTDYSDWCYYHAYIQHIALTTF